ncbi:MULTISPECIES: hypothetical protein [Pseudomonas]|nr:MULTISPECIES: hypothetical protein [Pseudomonas]AHF65276.1 hypothetical protein PCH70_01230 [Pseudomonas cichorii JBC1]QVE19827.1 hypothetical protein KGD89_00605 [Pseudomonas cichorii]SDO44115.1 hypothetical protein SAMN05216599_10929 [Pseudomonas cichorii]
MTAQTFRQNGDLLDPVMLGWFFLSLFLYSIRPGFVLITLPGVEARPG